VSLKKVMVSGRLCVTRQPGFQVVNFSVASDEHYVNDDGKRRERTESHKVVIFGKVALTCNQYLKKSHQIYVEGRLIRREFENKIGWRQQRRTEIVASRVQFLGAASTDLETSESALDSLFSVEPNIPFQK
jgi:single-strand DNA-binding protein